MTLRQILTGIALAIATALGATSVANATTVATISGCYDCLGQFDTPTLVINNATGGTMTNAQMVLQGYQGLNNGQIATVNLGNLGASTQLNWGSLPGVPGGTTPFSLTAYDYDDEFAGTPYMIVDPNCGFVSTNPSGCVAGGGPTWYAHTGNFNVTFTATISGGDYDGQTVFSVFSPHVNATGGFVGWEGLDQNGFSESDFDIHSGVITGHLADIDLGVAPPPPTTGEVPEPATWAMMLVGFGGLGAMLRHKRRGAIATA